jgi:hypothetical protein
LGIAIAGRQKDGGQKKAPINQARVNFSLHFSASHFSAFDAVIAHVEPPVRWSPDLGPEDSL